MVRRPTLKTKPAAKIKRPTVAQPVYDASTGKRTTRKAVKDSRKGNLLWRAATQANRAKAIKIVVTALGLPNNEQRQNERLTSADRWAALDTVNRLMLLEQWIVSESRALMMVQHGPDPIDTVGKRD